MVLQVALNGFTSFSFLQTGLELRGNEKFDRSHANLVSHDLIGVGGHWLNVSRQHFIEILEIFIAAKINLFVPKISFFDSYLIKHSV